MHSLYVNFDLEKERPKCYRTNQLRDYLKKFFFIFEYIFPLTREVRTVQDVHAGHHHIRVAVENIIQYLRYIQVEAERGAVHAGHNNIAVEHIIP